jgi:hypothetical protein
MPSSTENRRAGGQRGANFGLAIEGEFAQRINGLVLKNAKTDVMDSKNNGHSIKNSRKSNPRLLAKAYSCVTETNYPYSRFYPYIKARILKNKEEEKNECIRIAKNMNDPDFSKKILEEVMTGNEPNLKYLTCYDNRTESIAEDFTGKYRSFEISTIIDFYVKNLTWEAVLGKTHWSVKATLPDFKKKAMSICLGSEKRKLLLFNFDNMQSQLDYWEKCKIPVTIY